MLDVTIELDHKIEAICGTYLFQTKCVLWHIARCDVLEFNVCDDDTRLIPRVEIDVRSPTSRQ